MDFLKGLNAQQREAVSHTDGPLLILAGAGSGKTRVITHRIAHIITARHVPPSAVLAVTFTNKAAEEMRERVSALLEDVPLDSSPNARTFHSFCVRLLRRDGDPLARVRPGFTRRFTIYDDEDQLAIIKAAYRTLGLDEKEFMQYRAALSQISQAKNTKADAAGSVQERGQHGDRSVAAVFEEYEKALRNANALDFDDLLLETVRLLQHDEATREAWNRRLSYLMIDEYQDTNRSQYELMRLLTEAARQCLRGGRRRSVDLQLARRGHPEYPGFRARLSATRRPSGWSRITAPPRTFWKRRARWWRTIRSARARSSGPKSDAGDLLGLYAGYDAENEALFIADTIEKYPGAAIPTTAWRFSTAPTRSRARSKKRCAATAASTTWSAASASTSARKSRTWSRI